MLTNLEAVHFEVETMLKLRAIAESFGQVYYFAPIKSFGRVFVVYNSTLDARRAKTDLHDTEFEDTTLRVYFGQVTHIHIDHQDDGMHCCRLQCPRRRSNPQAKQPVAYRNIDRPLEALPAPTRTGKELVDLASWFTPRGLVPDSRGPTKCLSPGRRSGQGLDRDGTARLPTAPT